MRKSNPIRTGTEAPPGRASASATRKQMHGPLPAAHPYYSSVERLASEWRHLEHALDMVIWELAAVDQELGWCITNQLRGHWPRINAITALAAAKSADRTLIQDFEMLGSRLSKLDKRQNSFFDQLWSSGRDSFSLNESLDLIAMIDVEIIEVWQLRSRMRSAAAST